MKIGTRVLFPEEVNRWAPDLVQISVYKGMDHNLNTMKDCVRACMDADIRYVLHPVQFTLLDQETFTDIMTMAEWSDLALILHDERAPDNTRVSGPYDHVLRNAIEKLGSLTRVSFENAVNTGDVIWFWEKFAASVTLDIGHMESSGFDSTGFIRSLDASVIRKVEYVHMHRNNGMRGGITDHWPLEKDCREIKALKELLRVKPDVSVILELNEVDSVGDNLDLLRSLS